MFGRISLQIKERLTTIIWGSPQNPVKILSDGFLILSSNWQLMGCTSEGWLTCSYKKEGVGGNWGDLERKNLIVTLQKNIQKTLPKALFLRLLSFHIESQQLWAKTHITHRLPSTTSITKPRAKRKGELMGSWTCVKTTHLPISIHRVQASRFLPLYSFILIYLVHSNTYIWLTVNIGNQGSRALICASFSGWCVPLVCFPAPCFRLKN